MNSPFRIRNVLAAVLLVACATGCSRNERANTPDTTATASSNLPGTYGRKFVGPGGEVHQTLRLDADGNLALDALYVKEDANVRTNGRWSEAGGNVQLTFVETAGGLTNETMTLIARNDRLMATEWDRNIRGADPPEFTRVVAGAEPLVGGVWQWISTTTPVEVFVSNGPERYTLAFHSDSSATVRADCNRGRATYTVTESRQITFAPFILTLMGCPPGSMDREFMRELGATASYFMQGDTLMVDLKVDSGTMRFVRPTG